MAGRISGNKRKDNNRVVLRTGEGMWPNGTYDYRWTDKQGKRHHIYARTLPELREKEEQIQRDISDGDGAEAEGTAAERKGENPRCDSGTDIGTHHDSDGIGERKETGINEADKHQCGRSR